jgi:hypothetical protein
MAIPGVSRKRIDFPFQMGPWLLGIDYCHIRWDEPVWSKSTGRPASDDWFIKSNTGMMGVVPCWKLAEILEGNELGPMIESLKKKVAKAAAHASANSPAELDVASMPPPAGDANPKHREDFTSLVGAAARKQKQGD